MEIDHICLAVKNLSEGIEYWSRIFGYEQKTKIIENSRQKVKVTFLGKNNHLTLKLIQPTETNLSLVNFVNRGGGFHHLCFKCSNIDEKIKELTEEGLILLVPPQPGEAFNNHNIAFLLARYGLNIELIDTDERSGLI